MGYCFLTMTRLSSLAIPLLLIYLSSVAALLPSVCRRRSTLSSGRQLRPWHNGNSGSTGAATENHRRSHHSKINPPLQENQSPTDRSSSDNCYADKISEPPGVGMGVVSKRRKFLAGSLLPTTTTTAFALLSSRSTTTAANAIDNPLNLKGTFWETGQLYQKSDASLPEDGDDGDFLSTLENAVEALRSPLLSDAISEGDYGRASRLLRGGLISESRIRIAANYLIDEIPEENDEAMYRASEGFRVFLRYLDVLDAEVEAASRPLSLGKGGGGVDDPRMKILTRLGEVEDALKAFLKSVRGGLGK